MNPSPLKLDYVSGVSWPRSGHHLLVRILGDYFGDSFNYCEFYNQEGCCKQSPCVRQDNISLSKNHDYDASLAVKVGHTYLVQYRRFQDSLVSDFELHVKHIGIDTVEEFRLFAERKLANYKLFMHRWATARANDTRIALLSYERFTADPVSAMRNVLPLFAPNSPIDEQRLADVIANASQITVSEKRSVKAEEKGVVARRDIRNFRYYDAEFFEKIDKEANDAYQRMQSLPLLRQHERLAAVTEWQPPRALYIDITGMPEIAHLEPTGIPRVQNFLLAQALADADPAVGAVIFDPVRKGYRNLGALELMQFMMVRAKTLRIGRRSFREWLGDIRSVLDVVSKEPWVGRKFDRLLACHIADRKQQPLLHSFFKQLIRRRRKRSLSALAHHPEGARVAPPLDLSSAVVLHSHMSVFGSGFQDTLGIDMRRAFICHDLIPWSRPNYAFDTQLARRFVTHLKVLVETGVHALSMSETTDQELGRYVASVDSATVRRDRFPMPAMLYHLASQRKMTDPIKAAEPFILYCSTIEVRKNHLLLARIWQRALDEGVHLPKLVCAGRRGWGIDELDAYMAAHPDLATHIEFRGGVTDAELIDLYRSALFGVMPSLDEGWGLPASECLDFGTPILISRIPALLEASQGLMPAIDPRDEDQWFEKIKQWSGDAALRDQLRATIRQRYHRVTPQESWSAVKSRLLTGT